jgi:hypothetical protein
VFEPGTAYNADVHGGLGMDVSGGGGNVRRVGLRWVERAETG